MKRIRIPHAWVFAGGICLLGFVACGGGGGGSSTTTVSPDFTTSPPTTATVGTLYTYTPVASEAGATVTISLTSTPPAGATFTSGVLTWTPTSAEAGTSCGFTLTASDGKGGSKTQVWSVTPGAAAATATGIFVDSPVAGLSYTSGAQTGVTSSTGQYTYEVGQTVTFSLGGITLPTIVGSALTTPMSIFNAGYGDTRVTNLARLLQTLDSDQNLANGISISAPTRTAAANITLTDFSSSSFDTTVAPLLTTVGVSQLESSSQAQTSLMDGSIIGTILKNSLDSQYTQLESVTFLPNGNMYHAVYAPSYPSDPADGISVHSYTWNPSNGACAITDPSINTIGDWGAFPQSMTISPDGTNYYTDGSKNIPRLTTSSTDPMQGTWLNYPPAPSEMAGIVLFMPGNYFAIIVLDGPDTTGKPGLEYGTYSVNTSTSPMQVTFSTVITNTCGGDWGLPAGTTWTVSISNNSFSVPVSDGTTTFIRLEP